MRTQVWEREGNGEMGVRVCMYSMCTYVYVTREYKDKAQLRARAGKVGGGRAERKVRKTNRQHKDSKDGYKNEKNRCE